MVIPMTVKGMNTTIEGLFCAKRNGVRSADGKTAGIIDVKSSGGSKK
jgi:hypothetical protein